MHALDPVFSSGDDPVREVPGVDVPERMTLDIRYHNPSMF
jgi:hypothetical protein